MKNIFAITASLILMTNTVMAKPLYEYRETTPVAPSVTMERVTQFHSDRNISYTVIKADLTAPDVSLELIKSKAGTDYLDTVLLSAKEEENTVASLNADFFSVHKGEKGFSLGIEIKDGTLLQSPINPDTMATVSYDGKAVDMSYLDFDISITAPDGTYAPVRHLNKHTSYYGDILMYTKDFNAGMSPAPGGEVAEVVVEDGVIKEFRRNLPPVRIPENGCVLVVSEGVSMFLANNFAVGDKIDISYTLSPDILSKKTAFGGGAMLVKDGKVCESFSHVISGLNPRSAIGTDKTGTILYLVAVDGRQTMSRGMEMRELAEFMLSLGCHNAVNLDGGGSTNMVAVTPWNSTLHTVNSPTENRKVINSVGIKYTGDDKTPEGILIESDKDVIFVGQQVKLKATAYDKSKRPIPQNISWSAEGGRIDNGVFVSASGGLATVTASLGNLTAEKQIHVVDEIAGIETDSYVSMKKGETKKLDINVFDKNGHYVNVTNLKEFDITSSNPAVVSIDGANLRAVGSGTSIITVKKDGAKSHVSVAVGGASKDEVYDFELMGGTYKGYPSYVEGKFNLSSDEVYGGLKSGELSYDFTSEKEESKGAYFCFDRQDVLADTCREISLMFYAPESFGHEMRVQFTDGNGKIAIAKTKEEIKSGEWQRLTFEIPDSFARPLTLDRVYALYTVGEEKDTGSVYIDDIRYETSEPHKFIPLPENVYTHSEPKGTASLAVSAVSDEKTLLSQFVNRRCEDAVSAYKEHVKIGNISSFASYEKSDFLFIELDVSKGGVRATDASQWNKLSSAIEQTNKKNIFILANSTIFGKDEFENKFITDYLASLNKNVAVITGASENTVTVKDGVSYYTLGNKSGAKMDMAYMRNYNYLEFSVDGNELTHKFKKCYE